MKLYSDLFKEVMYPLEVYLTSLDSNTIKFKFNCIGEIRNTSIQTCEFFFKCKKWAEIYGYNIYSGNNTIMIFEKESLIYNHTSNEIGEIDLVIQACLWLLLEIKGKK